MPEWVPFTGLTAFVLLLLLALARASQRVVRDDSPETQSGSPTGAGDAAGDDENWTGDSAAAGGGESTTLRTSKRDNGQTGHSTAGQGEDPPGSPGTETSSTDITGTGTPEETAVDSVVGEDSAVDSSTVTPGQSGRETVRADTGQAELDASKRPPGEPSGPEMSTPALLANVALTQGVFGGLVLAGALFYGIPGDALGVTGDPWSTGLPAVALGVAFGLALWGANELSASVADAVGAGYEEQLREMLAPDGRGGWVVLLGVVLPVIAFVEEFLFRAAAIGVPAAGFGISPWALAVVSSTVFAFGHGAQGRVGIVVTGSLGFVLAAGYILSGSLLVVVVAHYLVNALEFLVHEHFGANRLLS